LLKRAAIALAVLLAVLLIDAAWLAPSGLRVVEHRIDLHNGHGAALNGLRIAVIADLHAGAWYIDDAKISRVVQATNAAKPDIILLAGDYVVNASRRFGGTHVPIEHVASLLAGLKASLGVYAVIGNHDRWDGASRATAALEKAGVKVLEIQSVRITGEGRDFVLVGIGDYYTHASDPQRAFSNVAAPPETLCFTHSPDVFPELQDKCALTIAGHTHGGQDYFPLVGRLIVPSRYGQKYAAGEITENGHTLFVSTGIGTSLLPVRFLVPPEISVVTVSTGPKTQISG